MTDTNSRSQPTIDEIKRWCVPSVGAWHGPPPIRLARQLYRAMLEIESLHEHLNCALDKIKERNRQ